MSKKKVKNKNERKSVQNSLLSVITLIDIICKVSKKLQFLSSRCLRNVAARGIAQEVQKKKKKRERKENQLGIGGYAATLKPSLFLFPFSVKILDETQGDQIQPTEGQVEALAQRFPPCLVFEEQQAQRIGYNNLSFSD